MGKIVDRDYCMSSFLTFRYIVDEEKIFQEGIEHRNFKPVSREDQAACVTAADLDSGIRKMLQGVDLTKAALLLSGGMDSGILASYMPKGMKAYTARCAAQGAVDETKRAEIFCEKNGLEHVIVDVAWDDYMASMDSLMLQDGCPVFANEPQVYKLAEKIKDDGVELVIYGDHADIAFGGMDRLLSQDWDYNGWVDRFTFVKPERVLKKPVSMAQVYQAYQTNGAGIDYIRFLEDIFAASSSGAYVNAFRLAGLRFFDPYAYLKMGEPLDLNRVRSGDSKYLVRQLFRMKYPDLEVPEKIAMARASDQWMAEWEGPKRKEFLPDCIAGMTGEQKFLLYSLERFLNLLEAGR